MNEQPYKWMKLNDDNIILDVKIIPNSSKNMIIIQEDYLKIKLTAPPVDNKANFALVEFLAKELKASKSSINILSGNTSKNKRIMIPKASIAYFLNNC